MSDQEEDYHYNRILFFEELSQSIERKKLSTNVLFSNYLKDFNDIVQHNGLTQEEMNIIYRLLCTVNLSVQHFKQILSIFIPEEPSIPSDICEEIIIWILSVYHQSNNDETKAQFMLYWLLYVVEEKLTNMDTIDMYYKMLYYLINFKNLSEPIAGIIYNLTKSGDVQKWMITTCKQNISLNKSQSVLGKLLSFFENPNAVHKSRQKGLFDSNKPFCKKLAYGLRSVRKELVNIHPQSAHSQKLTEYVRKSSLGYCKLQFDSSNYKFELSAKYLAEAFMAQSISSNSLSLLDNTSGWCKLLFNTDEELNLHNRFSNNLKQILDQIFLSNEINMTPSKKINLLHGILEFQKFSQRGLVAVNQFLFEYLLSWDGMENARIIFELFEYLSFKSEEELKNRFLDKLYAIFITGDELIYRMVINSLTKLLCNLHLNAKVTRTDTQHILFGKKLRDETEMEIVKCLTKYSSHWCSLCIYHYPHDEQLKHTVYTFFEKVSILENLEPYMWPLWTIVPPNVFYNGLMSINIYWLDRLSKLILRYIKYDTSRIEKVAVDKPWIFESLKMFDLYMADFYNALQAGSLFEKRNEGFLFKNINQEEIQKDLKMVNLNICFQMEKHIALAPYFMNPENTDKDPLVIIEAEAPNLHKLILTLNENLHSESSLEEEC